MKRRLFNLLTAVALIAALLIPTSVVLADPAWLAGEWDQRVKLTIDNTDVGETLTNFPVLVYLSASSGRTSADVSFVFDELTSDANRKKIAVTTSDEVTQCYVEIEKWVDASETAWLWVKVPTISSTVDTDLYLYYDIDHADNTTYVGDAGSVVAENVWDTNYISVWHLSGTAGDVLDSTGTNDGTNVGATRNVAGQISKAFSFDGANDYVDTNFIPGPELTDDHAFTVSVFIKPTAAVTGDVFSSYETNKRFFISNNDVEYTWGIGNTYDITDTGCTVTDGVWQQVDVVYNGTNVLMYSNGTGVYSEVYTGNGDYPDTRTAYMGAQHYTASKSWLDCDLDEVRVSNVARSNHWIKASNESSTDDLLAFGSEEGRSAPTVSTSAASSVEETTATLNGNLTSLGSYTPVYAFFQYGLTAGYGTNTTEQSKTETGVYSANIADLSPGTTYHFRAAVKYDTSYVYGSDLTLDTKPNPPTGVSATTGATSVTLTWTKGTGAATTVIRRSTTAFPTTPASGDSVYAGAATEVVDDTLVFEQTYYYSLWSKSSADVYSDTYATKSATPSADVLSPPDTLQIIDVKVFSGYFEYEDNLYVIRYKIIYDAGDPVQDCADFFNFELLDGSTLIAQVAVKSWGYKPGSVYLNAISAPDWGGAYTVKLIGNSIAWGEPPETTWNLTSGDWVGADLTSLDTWVISSAEAIQIFYGIQMVIYAATGTVLSDQGGIIFNMGIPGLSIEREDIFSTSAQFVGPIPEEHVIDPGSTMTMTNVGTYITGLFEQGADLVDIETTTFGSLVFGGGYVLVAVLLGTALGGALIGMGIASPILILGTWFGLVQPALLFVIAIIFILFIVKAIWLHGM